ncbi:MAG: electron transfer flavoprotein subunit beta/FixA family protein [Oligoflexus sp.]
MKIMVLLKKTPDTETKIQLSGDGSSIDHSQTKFIINPYDEFAIEEALQLKEKSGAGEVIIASFGSDDTKELIIKGLAMGGDRGLLINNEGLEQADSLTIAKVLAAAAKTEEVDLIFCGKQGIDADNMHVPTMVAEVLDWPHINVVNKVSLNGNQATVEREVEGGQVEVYDVELPAVLGANKALNSPRYASLPGIMKAKKKPFDRKTVGDIGLDLSELQSGILTEVKGYEYPPEKAAGQVFQGEDIEVMVDKVVALLRDEAKVL